MPVEGKKDEGTNISWQFFDSKKQINDASLKKMKTQGVTHQIERKAKEMGFTGSGTQGGFWRSGRGI